MDSKESAELGMSVPVGWPRTGESSRPVSVVALFLVLLLRQGKATRSLFHFSRGALIRLSFFVRPCTW